MRTPPNDENSISGQMARRGMRPQYTLDQMPGYVNESVESARNAYRQARPGTPSMDSYMDLSGGNGPISPDMLAQLQEAYRRAMEMGADGSGPENPYGNDIFAGGMGPNGGPNPRRLARKARKLERRKMRQDRLGGVKPKPAVAVNDGADMEPDFDMDDPMTQGDPVYGDGKPSGRDGEAPSFTNFRGDNPKLDPNKQYRNRFSEMANQPKPPMQGGQGGGPMDREKLKAYLMQMGMR